MAATTAVSLRLYCLEMELFAWSMAYCNIPKSKSLGDSRNKSMYNEDEPVYDTVQPSSRWKFRT